MQKLRFALFSNQFQARKYEAINKLADILGRYEADIYIDRPLYDLLHKDNGLTFAVAGVFEGNDFDADFAVSMGGDGTLLRTASRVGIKNIPIIGVNIGRLGFLADVNPTEIENAIESLFNGTYKVYEHTALQVDTVGGRKLSGSVYALNEVAVLKRDTASMISVHAEVDDEYLMTYQADGLIVTTPTGSTAYSLSNGGPILVPNTRVLCLTPVAPHSLSVRPIVIPDDAVVSLKVSSRSHNFLLAVDGRSDSLPENVSVTIRKAPFRVKVVRLGGRSYYDVLREKMMWGADQR